MQESFCKIHDSHDDTIIPAVTTLAESDIEIICEMCDIAWKNFFSKPLPNYGSMQVYHDGKLRIFTDLNRNDQIEIIKSVHVPTVTEDILKYQQGTTANEFENFVRGIVLFNQGNLLMCHGMGHAVRTAITAQKISIEYVKNFTEFEEMTPRILLLSLTASLLHDIGRCFGGDGSDIFGATSAYVAGEIMKEVGVFTDEEIRFVMDAIEVGSIEEKDVKEFRQKKSAKLNEKQIIACIMGDADSFEFERFRNCIIDYTSIKKLGILTKDGQSPDYILNSLKKESRNIINRIREPHLNKKSDILNEYDLVGILRSELLKINLSSASNQ